jgi:nucleoside-diphosphate-sugar epimerase
VLVLGGVGMIGRNLVQHLVATAACSHIRVADKRMPFMAFMR